MSSGSTLQLCSETAVRAVRGSELMQGLPEASISREQSERGYFWPSPQQNIQDLGSKARPANAIPYHHDIINHPPDIHVSSSDSFDDRNPL